MRNNTCRAVFKEKKWSRRNINEKVLKKTILGSKKRKGVVRFANFFMLLQKNTQILLNLNSKWYRFLREYKKFVKRITPFLRFCLFGCLN